MVEMFRDILKKVQKEISAEKVDREQSEEALLTLLEETCARLNKSSAI